MRSSVLPHHGVATNSLQGLSEGRSRTRLLDEADDLKLLRCGEPHVWSAPRSCFFAAAGAVVIDNSSCWRYDSDVPLIVPEVNADAVAGFRKRGIIANPNCSTAQLVVPLKPLHDKARITRVVVATYQSVSGAGKEAMDELFSQTKAVFQINEVEAKQFPKRIAFNIIPQIDTFMEDGSTREER